MKDGDIVWVRGKVKKYNSVVTVAEVTERSSVNLAEDTLVFIAKDLEQENNLLREALDGCTDYMSTHSIGDGGKNYAIKVRKQFNLDGEV